MNWRDEESLTLSEMWHDWFHECRDCNIVIPAEEEFCEIHLPEILDCKGE